MKNRRTIQLLACLLALFAVWRLYWRDVQDKGLFVAGEYELDDTDSTAPIADDDDSRSRTRREWGTFQWTKNVEEVRPPIVVPVERSVANRSAAMVQRVLSEYVALPRKEGRRWWTTLVSAAPSLISKPMDAAPKTPMEDHATRAYDASRMTMITGGNVAAISKRASAAASGRSR
jgi:hypothetical protein